MKILITTLLLTIAVFLNFGEFSAKGIHREGSSRANQPYIRRERTTQPPPRLHPYRRNGPTRLIPYIDGHTIEAWLDPTGTVLSRAELQDNQYVPTGIFLRMANIAIFSDVRDNIRFVVYKRDDGTILGVRAPKPLARANALEPNESTWFFTYNGESFKVEQDPATRRVTRISLMPYGNVVTEENRHILETHRVFMFGLRFLVHEIRTTGRIMGAELDLQPHN